MPACICYGWDIQPHTLQRTDHVTYYRCSMCLAYHLNCLCICALESAINLCLAQICGLAVNADALCNGVKGVLQPLAFRLLLSVHHASCHLQADAPFAMTKGDCKPVMSKGARNLITTNSTTVPVSAFPGARVGCLDPAEGRWLHDSCLLLC